MIACEEDVVPKGGRSPFISPPDLPIGSSASYFYWLIPLHPCPWYFMLRIWDKFIQVKVLGIIPDPYIPEHSRESHIIYFRIPSYIRLYV